MLRKTLHLRLLILTLGLVGGILIAFSLALYWGMVELLMVNLDASLVTVAKTEIASLVDGENEEVHFHEEAGIFQTPEQKSPWPHYLQLLTPDGQVVLTNLENGAEQALPVNPLLLQQAKEGTVGWEISRILERKERHKYRPLRPLETWFKMLGSMDDDDIRLAYVPVTKKGEIHYILQVGASMGHYHNAVERITHMLAVGLPIGLILIGLGSLLLTTRTLQPVKHITETAGKIGEDNLSQRLTVSTDDRVLGRLVAVFNAMLERLERAFNAQRQFTADASHEIRSPLAIMRANLELALLRERKPEEYRRIIASNLEEIDRMTRLVEGLLTLARADYGEASLKSRAVEMGELLQNLTTQFQPLAGAKGIALSFKGMPQPVLVMGDEDRLKQLYSNLIENALRYTPAGGKVVVTLNQEGEWIKTEVADTGIGIPAEHLDLIFKRFYRVDKARSREMGGSGLGLAICRWIVSAHQGKIKVYSEEGQGSTFVVWLPCFREEN